MSQMLKLRHAGLEWADTGTEIIALDADRDTYMAGNGSVKALWPLLVEGSTTDDLVAHLVAVYAVEAGVARVDVEDFVSQLKEKGLLEQA